MTDVQPGISDELVEKAAQAIHEHDMHDPWDDEGCNDTGDGTYASCKDGYLSMARAALEAVAVEIRAKALEEASQYASSALAPKAARWMRGYADELRAEALRSGGES
jgi:hypothetical protein